MNRAVYGSLEKHWQPLGLHYPKSQSLGIILSYTNKNNVLFSILYKRQLISDQYIDSIWNAWDNKISIFDTNNILPDECRILIENFDSKFLIKLVFILITFSLLKTRYYFQNLSKYK